MIRTSNKQLLKQVKFMKKHGIPFRLKQTNERIEIDSKLGQYINKESFFPPHELNFIKRVKNHILKYELHDTVPKRFKTEKQKKKIKYFSYRRKHKPGSFFNDVYEIDLKSAYFEEANKMGLLSPDLYLMGKQVSKKTRLACIGTLAKKTKIIHFDGFNENKEPIEILPTAHIWDAISNGIGKKMMAAAKLYPQSFLFFWVDALFVEGKNHKKILNFFKDQGYEVTVTKLDWVKYADRHIIVKGKGKWRKVSKKKLDEYEKRGLKINREKCLVWWDERQFPYKHNLELQEALNQINNTSV